MKKNRFGLLLFIIGIGFTLYPAIVHFQQGKEIEQLEMALEMIQNDKMEEDFLTINMDELQDVVRLSIPSIDLDQPVLATLSEENLNVALTQIKQNQVLGKGNFTIAGHLSTVDGRFFNRLPEVQIGEQVFITSGTDIYTYEIESNEVIEATDVNVLDDDENKSEITLITCTPSGKKRVAVKGRLVHIESSIE